MSRSMHVRRVGVLVGAVAVAALGAIGLVGAQRNNSRNPDCEWPMYNRDYAGTRFSPLAQINTANVGKLTRAWSYKLRPEGKELKGQIPSEHFQEVTPTVVNGVMYLPSGNQVVALEPETGKAHGLELLRPRPAAYRASARNQRGRTGRCLCLRCRQRQGALEVPHDSASRRSGQRNLGLRYLEEPHLQQRLGLSR